MSIHKTTPKTTLSEYLFATLFKERKKLGKLMEGGAIKSFVIIKLFIFAHLSVPNAELDLPI